MVVVFGARVAERVGTPASEEWTRPRRGGRGKRARKRRKEKREESGEGVGPKRRGSAGGREKRERWLVQTIPLLFPPFLTAFLLASPRPSEIFRKLYKGKLSYRRRASQEKYERRCEKNKNVCMTLLLCNKNITKYRIREYLGIRMGHESAALVIESRCALETDEKRFDRENLKKKREEREEWNRGVTCSRTHAHFRRSPLSGKIPRSPITDSHFPSSKITESSRSFSRRRAWRSKLRTEKNDAKRDDGPERATMLKEARR